MGKHRQRKPGRPKASIEIESGGKEKSPEQRKGNPGADEWIDMRMQFLQSQAFKHKGDPKTWPPLLQDLEGRNEMKELVAGPREVMPESFLRESIARHLAIRPEDVTPNQIRHAVSEVLPYDPAISVSSVIPAGINEALRSVSEQVPEPAIQGASTTDTPQGFYGLGPKKHDLHLGSAKLTDRQQDCLSMKVEYELPISAIARRLSLHHSTVQESLNAANKRLGQDQNYQRVLKRLAAHRSNHDE